METKIATFSPMGPLTAEFAASLNAKYKYEETVTLINLRIQAALQFPPEHDEFTTDEDSIHLIHVPLEEVFEDMRDDTAKRFFYYLISSPDIAWYIRLYHGVTAAGLLLGNKTAIAIDREAVNVLNCFSPTIVDSWRQFKLLSQVVCNI